MGSQSLKNHLSSCVKMMHYVINNIMQNKENFHLSRNVLKTL